MAVTRKSVGRGHAARLHWRGNLEKDLRRFPRTRLLPAVQVAFGRMSSEMETYAKVNAPWTDRTGNARQGLYARVYTEGDTVTVELGHGPAIDYGVDLELKRDGKYAIVGPTLNRYAPQLPRRIKAALGLTR